MGCAPPLPRHMLPPARHVSLERSLTAQTPLAVQAAVRKLAQARSQAAAAMQRLTQAREEASEYAPSIGLVRSV